MGEHLEVSVVFPHILISRSSIHHGIPIYSSTSASIEHDTSSSNYTSPDSLLLLAHPLYLLSHFPQLTLPPLSNDEVLHFHSRCSLLGRRCQRSERIDICYWIARPPNTEQVSLVLYMGFVSVRSLTESNCIKFDDCELLHLATDPTVQR